MNFALFAFTCVSFVIAAQVVHVSSLNETMAEKETIDKLADEFIKQATQLKNEIKDNTQVQDFFKTVEELGEKVSQMAKDGKNKTETLVEEIFQKQEFKDAMNYVDQLKEDLKQNVQQFFNNAEIDQIWGGFVNTIKKTTNPGSSKVDGLQQSKILIFSLFLVGFWLM